MPTGVEVAEFVLEHAGLTVVKVLLEKKAGHAWFRSLFIPGRILAKVVRIKDDHLKIDCLKNEGLWYGVRLRKVESALRPPFVAIQLLPSKRLFFLNFLTWYRVLSTQVIEHWENFQELTAEFRGGLVRGLVQFVLVSDLLKARAFIDLALLEEALGLALAD